MDLTAWSCTDCKSCEADIMEEGQTWGYFQRKRYLDMQLIRQENGIGKSTFGERILFVVPFAEAFSAIAHLHVHFVRPK